jgi:hypothetical protein
VERKGELPSVVGEEGAGDGQNIAGPDTASLRVEGDGELVVEDLFPGGNGRQKQENTREESESTARDVP